MPTDSPPATAAVSSRPTSRLRLWLPTIALILFWVIVVSSYQLDLAMFMRFISRMGAHLALLLTFLVWWFASRRFPLRLRFLVVGILAACWILGTLVSHPSMNLFSTLLAGFPFVLTLGTAWLWLSRNRSDRVQVAGLAAVGVSVAGVLALLRWDGLDGRQQTMYSFRWTPSAEEAFLASRHPASESTPLANAPEDELAIQPGDWPGFKGGEREGVVSGAELGDWSANTPAMAWRHRIGPGWSSMAIVDGRLLTQEQRGASEAVVCYDAATGEELWAHLDSGRFDEALSGTGPRGTPGFCANRVYSLGARGLLNCLSATTGEPVWSHDLVAEYGAAVPQWGTSSSPLITDQLVIVYAAGSDGRGLVAFHAETGQQVWAAPAGTQSYSSPQLITIAGVPQVVMHDNKRLFAVDPDGGKLLWETPHPDENTVPMLQPHPVNQSALIMGWADGIARLRVEQQGAVWIVSEQWKSNRFKPGFNDFVIHEGFIYGLDDGIFCCVDAADGKRMWKKGRYGFGQILLLPEQDRIVVLTEKGDVVLLATDSTKLEELARFPAIEGKCWNHPVLAHGRLFVRNGEEMAAYVVGAK